VMCRETRSCVAIETVLSSGSLFRKGGTTVGDGFDLRIDTMRIGGSALDLQGPAVKSPACVETWGVRHLLR
jgi:hypothetical protein